MGSVERSSFTIQSIERAAAVMRSFSEAQPELGVTELSRRLRLHKSTVSRILSTLQNEGFVSQNRVTGKYRLGVGLISLAGVALGQVDVRSAAYPHLDALVEETRESVGVAILDGAESVNVLHKPSPKPIRYVNWIGRRLPLHCTASGKVLLAGMTPEERAARLPRDLGRYTAATLAAPEQLRAELSAIAGRGYALAMEEYEEGYSAIAVPIYNHEGRVAGALSISGPTFRLPEETLLGFTGNLLQTAARISADLGYSGRVKDEG